MSKGKKRLPSQQKYDQTHPTVSFRLPAPLYVRLKQHLGEHSFASFVISHLENEEARINARVEELVRQRGSLRTDIASYQRQLHDLDEQVKKRRQEIMKPLEEEKVRLKAEIDEWYRFEKQRFELTRAQNEKNLSTVRSQVNEEQERLRQVRMDLIFAETRHKSLEQQSKQWLEEKKAWEEKMQHATDFINRYPWFFCNQCPGALWNQMLLSMANTLASIQSSAKNKDDSVLAKVEEGSRQTQSTAGKS